MKLKKIILILLILGLIIYILFPKQSVKIIGPSGYSCPCLGIPLISKSTKYGLEAIEGKCVGIVPPYVFCKLIIPFAPN